MLSVRVEAQLLSDAQKNKQARCQKIVDNISPLYPQAEKMGKPIVELIKKDSTAIRGQVALVVRGGKQLFIDFQKTKLPQSRQCENRLMSLKQN